MTNLWMKSWAVTRTMRRCEAPIAARVARVLLATACAPKYRYMSFTCFVPRVLPHVHFETIHLHIHFDTCNLPATLHLWGFSPVSTYMSLVRCEF
jgi:hypothetical protein